MNIRGKVVLITGAASGIGAELARQLHGKGASLVLVDLDGPRLGEVAGGLGSDVVSAVADVRDLSSVAATVDAGIARFGGIDVVVANAGIAVFGSVLNVDPAAFKTLLDVNALGVFHTVRAALPSVIERRGYILVVSSMAAYIPVPGSASYSLAKAGVEHFANALRLEVAPLGVDVGSAHMSWIDTPMVREGKAQYAAFRAAIDNMPGVLSKTTPVATCARAFVKGIEKRKRRVNCPGWVSVFQWVKPILTTRWGERTLVESARELVPGVDAESAALGRSTSARIDALEGSPALGDR